MNLQAWLLTLALLNESRVFLRNTLWVNRTKTVPLYGNNQGVYLKGVKIMLLELWTLYELLNMVVVVWCCGAQSNEEEGLPPNLSTSPQGSSFLLGQWFQRPVVSSPGSLGPPCFISLPSPTQVIPWPNDFFLFCRSLLISHWFKLEQRNI